MLRNQLNVVPNTSNLHVKVVILIEMRVCPLPFGGDPQKALVQFCVFRCEEHLDRMSKVLVMALPHLVGRAKGLECLGKVRKIGDAG